MLRKIKARRAVGLNIAQSGRAGLLRGWMTSAVGAALYRAVVLDNLLHQVALVLHFFQGKSEVRVSLGKD
jgi:hypothetical protein